MWVGRDGQGPSPGPPEDPRHPACSRRGGTEISAIDRRAHGPAVAAGCCSAHVCGCEEPQQRRSRAGQRAGGAAQSVWWQAGCAASTWRVCVALAMSGAGAQGQACVSWRWRCAHRTPRCVQSDGVALCMHGALAAWPPGQAEQAAGRGPGRRVQQEVGRTHGGERVAPRTPVSSWVGAWVSVTWLRLPEKEVGGG